MPLNNIDQHFLQIAQMQGQKTTSSKKRGAVLAEGNKILGVGTSAHLDPAEAAGGMQETGEHYVATINAEVVCLGSAIRAGGNLNQATMYSSDQPNWITFKILVALGIKRLVYYGPVKMPRIVEYANRMNIENIVVG